MVFLSQKPSAENRQFCVAVLRLAWLDSTDIDTGLNLISDSDI